MAATPEVDAGLIAALPHLMRVGSVLSRSELVEQAMRSAGADLDRPAVTVLVTLQQAGAPLRVGDIADRMRVAGPHVTRHVHELERRGLVRRLTDAGDRRARLIEPTDAGAAAAGRYVETVLRRLGEATADWSAEDRGTFYRLLRRFADDLVARFADVDGTAGP